MKSICIYTDGACSGNPGPGGWAAVLLYDKQRLELSGYEPHTTNNRMELLAVIKALEALKSPCRIRLYSDSTYVCNAFTKGWFDGWRKMGFKRKGSDIPNRDLWEKLQSVMREHIIEWLWVRGHAENQENNRCDALARAAISDGRNAPEDRSTALKV